MCSHMVEFADTEFQGRGSSYNSRFTGPMSPHEHDVLPDHGHDGDDPADWRWTRVHLRVLWPDIRSAGLLRAP